MSIAKICIYYNKLFGDLMLDVHEIVSRKREFSIALVFSVLLNITLHYALDVTHFPLFVDKAGLLIIGYSFGPVAALISAIITSLFLSITDVWYIFRSINFILVALLWGFGLVLSRVKNNDRYLIVAWIISPFASIISELAVFTAVMYYPFKSDTLPYVKPLNLFVLQGIDTAVSFIVGLFILFMLGVKDFRKRTSLKALTKKQKALLFVFLVLLGGGTAFLSYAHEKALVPYLPKPDGWVFVNVRMDFVWAPMGVRGSNNYYYPETRFNSSDPGYQVWFGLYWVQGKFGLYGDTYDQNEIFAFSIFDQNTWLSLYGLKTPKTTVHNITGVAWGEFKGYKALFMNGSYNSQSDVPPYEDVVLIGFFIVFYMEKYDRTVIIYACAVDRYYSIMEPILWDFAMSVELP